MFNIKKSGKEILGYVWHVPTPASELTGKLPGGVYNYIPPNMSNPIPKFIPATFCHEEMVVLTGGVYDTLNLYLDNFLSKGGVKHYKNMGLLWKTGILLYGVPGTGKTMLTHQLMGMLVEKYDAVVIHGPDGNELSQIVSLIRKDDPKRVILMVCEEVEYNIHYHENSMLEFLDGSQSTPGVIFLGTTNYLNNIPDRIRDRPSRFNLVLEIPTPDLDQRTQILTKKIPEKMHDVIGIDILAEATEGMTLDHVKATLLYMTVHGKSLEESIGLVKGLGLKASEYKYTKVGFTPEKKQPVLKVMKV